MWTIFVLLFAALEDLLEIIADFKKERPTIWMKCFFGFKIFMVVVLTSTAIYQFNTTSTKEDANATSGEMFNKLYDDSSVVVKFGTNSYRATKAPLRIDGTLLNVYKEGRRLIVEMQIKDSEGNTIVDINKDGWARYSSFADLNNDETAFEVVRSDKRVIFQIELLRDTVFCRGILFGNGGFFTSDGQYDPIPRHSEQIWLPKDLNIKRIFKYPRSKFVHLRDEQ